ncbi:MAG TPA: lipid A deacylase LpxR family protein [Candidatus Polarisedimenticolia bacterium]|nr:lipid A deacylase LpxR family protein [Candidatus Polarisedimenticolia bacterium]
MGRASSPSSRRETASPGPAVPPWSRPRLARFREISRPRSRRRGIFTGEAAARCFRARRGGGRVRWPAPCCVAETRRSSYNRFGGLSIPISRNPGRRRRGGGSAIRLVFLMAGLFAVCPPLPAGEDPPKSPWDLKMFRFEFDNDNFVGSDDAFSAGWSFQIHSKLMDQWNPAYAGWIGRIPGLGDDGRGDRVVRWAYGVTQMILTPADISIETPQPDDVPWAGYAGLVGSWSSYDNRRLAAIQVYLGCKGPCSQAEDVQKFVHNKLGLGEDPQGWGNQLSYRALANLNYEYRYKLAAPRDLGKYKPGRYANDLTVGSMAAAGNLNTRLTAKIEYRFGWGLPMGFTKIPDPPGVGMMLDPVYLVPGESLDGVDGWRFYFNVVGRYAWIAYYSPAEGGTTESGYHHHAANDPYPGNEQVLLGLHVARVRFGFHLTYYRYFNNPENLPSNFDWTNLSFEYRF